MSIRIKIGKRVYELCMGYKTPWSSQIWFIAIMQLWFNESKEVSFAEIVFHS